jgi:hypothetical protein
MAPSQPVQNGLGDLQRELLTSRYSTAAPLDPVLPGTKTAAPKAEEKRPFASQDWFERSADKADGGRTALENLMARMKGLADAAEQRRAAERVADAATAPADATEASGPLYTQAWNTRMGSAAAGSTPETAPPPTQTAPTEPPPSEPTQPPPTEPPKKDKGLLGIFGG